MIAHLLKIKGIQLSEEVDIHPQSYLFQTLIKGTKKKNVKKTSTAAEPSVSSNALLVLLKTKRVKKPMAKSVE